MTPRDTRVSLTEIAAVFLRLGVTAFGGPAVHVAMMEEEIVRRRKWIEHQRFLDLFGAANLIPGPNSTELAIHIGHDAAGFPGLLVAGACFIVPAATITLALAWAYVRFGALPAMQGLLWAVKPVVVAVVAQALFQLGKKAIKSWPLLLLAATAAVANALGVNELVVLACAAAVALAPASRTGVRAMMPIPAAASAIVGPLPLFLVFAKIGAVLFGSGYVLLAFLRAELVERRHWLTEAQLLDAVAAGQVTPGPVFTTATFVGYVIDRGKGALLATAGIFLPAFVFVAITGPLLPRLTTSKSMRRVLDGVNAASLALMAVVSFRLARGALVDPLTIAIALGSLLLLVRFKANSTWLVLAAAAIGVLRATGCTPHPPAKMPEGRSLTFQDDVAYLRGKTSVHLLENSEGGKVAVVPEWQGRVMTSAVADDARSLGFVHRAFIDGGKRATAFDNYGGEDRFWLGPEGTRFSLYFAKGAPLDFDHWQTPHAFNEGAWEVASASSSRIAMKRALHLDNHAGTTFDVGVERSVELLDRAAAKSVLGVEIPAGVRMIAFATTNAIENAGKEPWNKESGLPNVWILGMYAPSKDTTAIIPFDPNGAGPIVRDDYFGKVPESRLVKHDGFLAFTCDGEHRSKIGIPPARARAVLGSYSPAAHLLTIVHFDRKANASDYPSGVWREDADPYAGDVVNAYNDGPVGPGKPSLGGFYELETTSPAAALAPGEKLRHIHRTFHFVGDRAALDPIARTVLGYSLP